MQYYTIPRNTVQPETPQKQSLDTQVVRENENVTLGCDATGYPKVGFQFIYILSYLIYPKPHIVWRREDGEDIVIGGKKVKKYLKIRRELLFVRR